MVFFDFNGNASCCGNKILYAGGNGSLEATFSYQGNATSGNIYLRNSNRTNGAEYFYRFNIGASVAITAKNGNSIVKEISNV
jgi:hypothetical protein